MRRNVGLKVFRAHKQELEGRYGITRLGIFGSVARDEAEEIFYICTDDLQPLRNAVREMIKELKNGDTS